MLTLTSSLLRRLVAICLALAGVGAPLSAGVSRLSVKSERTIVPGVRYVQYKTNGKRPTTVHAVIYDRTIPGLAVRVVKGGNLSTARERLKDMAARYQTATNNEVLAIVNANFWAAGRSTPIGPCVIDGEVVEMTPYKHWSSAFFDIDGRMTIDTFRLQGWVEAHGTRYVIESTNRRLSDSTIVLYNSFVGPEVPYVSPAIVEYLFAEGTKDTTYLEGDSTERTIDTLELREEIARARAEADIEHSFTKLRLKYLRQPSVNKPTPCLMLGADTGTVAVPEQGCLVSLPRQLGMQVPKIGDTVIINFFTNIEHDRRFVNAVCGTPRIVRNGRANPEAKQEGVTGRRFIRNKLARTCLGTDRQGNKLILVAIEPTVTSERQYGATLAETAQIMRLLGAYQAMNLDGGGSSGMVVEHDHVFFDGEDPETRPISVGLGVVKLGHVLRQYNK